MMMTNGRRLAPESGRSACPDGSGNGKFARMNARLLRWRSVVSLPFAGAAVAMGVLSGCGRSGPMPDNGVRPRILTNSAVTLLGRAHRISRTSVRTDATTDGCAHSRATAPTRCAKRRPTWWTSSKS
jgi:hypothetical protein